MTPGGLAPRVLRLAVFAVVVGAGLAWLAGRVDRAPAAPPMLALGAGLAELSGAADDASGRPRALELNGATLHFQTATRPEQVAAVLDEAAAACAGGALREGLADRGYVACAAELTAEERAVAGTTEAIGVEPGYRYVYAQRGEGTLVVRFWTARPLELEALFPDAGDAPGRDAEGLPRPPGARRVLSARELGAPQALTVYVDPTAEPAALERWYRSELGGRGWASVGPGSPPAGGDRVLVTRRAERLAALVFTGDGDGGRSVAILTSR